MTYRSVYDSLRNRYLSLALAPDTLFLLRPSDAFHFIEEACALGLDLAGIEGFQVTESGAYQPCQSFSNDVADFVGSREEFFKESKRLIKQIKNERIRIQIVIEGLD